MRRLEVEARNISIAGVWTFAVVWLVGSFVLGADLLIALVIFFIAIAVSYGLSILPKSGAAGTGQGR